MVEQEYFDNYYYPVPVPTEVFYFVEFNQLRWEEGHLIQEHIAAQDIELNHLDLIEDIAIDYFKLFRTLINIQITKKRDRVD